MKKLHETFIYKMLDKSNDLTGQIQKISMPNNRLPLEDLQYDIDVINRRFNYLLRNKVIKDVQDRVVVPVFNPDTIHLPHFCPAVGMMEEGKAKSFVNLTNLAKYTKDHNFEIDRRQLFAVLQTGTILRECSGRWNQLTMNAVIMKSGAQIYAKMFGKVLDKMYAINLNKQRTDMVYYVLAKFFLRFMLEKPDSETIDTAAYQSCFNGTTKQTVTMADQNFTEDAYLALDKFVENLATMDGLNGLTIRGFIENWMKMFGHSTVLGLEYFPYYLHTIFSAMINAHLNSEYIIEPLVNRDTVAVYNEIGRLIR